MSNYVYVVIPNYNKANFIERCILSIIEQDYPYIKIIVIDDGSTDNSLEIIKQLKEQYDLQIITQFNQNAAIARNRGIEYITKGFVLFLDSDDYLERNVISKMVFAIENDETDMVIGGYTDLFSDGREKKYRLSSNILNLSGVMGLSKESPVPSNKLFKYEIIKKNNLFFDNVRIGQDVNFYLKYLIHCKTVSCIDENIYFHRVMDTAMSKRISLDIIDVCKAFEYIEEYYKKHKWQVVYEKYIAEIAYKNYFWQMMKFRSFKSVIDRKIILAFFLLKLRRLESLHNITLREKWLSKFVIILRPFLVSELGCKVIRYIIDRYENGKIQQGRNTEKNRS